MQREEMIRLLKRFVPEAACEQVTDWIIQYRVHFHIAHDRKTLLGNYYHPHNGKGHKITVNYDLNPFAFLVTFVHEMAHLITWEQHRNRVKPHGKEWKQNYRHLMFPLIQEGIFPPDIAFALDQYLENPAASSCADPELMKTLHQYNKNPQTLVEELPEGAHFRLSNGMLFEKGPLLRKRFKCREINTGRWYYVNGQTPISLPAMDQWPGKTGS